MVLFTAFSPEKRRKDLAVAVHYIRELCKNTKDEPYPLSKGNSFLFTVVDGNDVLPVDFGWSQERRAMSAGETRVTMLTTQLLFDNSLS